MKKHLKLRVHHKFLSALLSSPHFSLTHRWNVKVLFTAHEPMLIVAPSWALLPLYSKKVGPTLKVLKILFQILVDLREMRDQAITVWVRCSELSEFPIF
jgi:hypothetical protein